MVHYIIVAFLTLSSSALYSVNGYDLFTSFDLNACTLCSGFTSCVFSLLPLTLFSIDLKQKLILSCMSSIIGAFLGRKNMQIFYGNTRFGDNEHQGHIIVKMPFFGDQTITSPKEKYCSMTKTVTLTAIGTTIPTFACAYYLEKNNSLFN